MSQFLPKKNPIHYYRYFAKYYTTSKILKAAIFYFYKIVKQSLFYPKNDKTVEVNGYKLSVIPNDRGISLELLLFKTHEPLTTNVTCNELKKGMVCLDVGSNIGYYALLESRLIGSEGKVIAVEPSPENFRYLTNNLQLQNASNVETYNIALGNVDGSSNLLVTNKSNHSKIISEEQSIPVDGNLVNVPIKKIDSFLKEKQITRVDFVRMDVEGYESHILDGMIESLRKFKPMIQIEVHKMYMGPEETKRFLKKFQGEGYDTKYYIAKDMEYPIIGNMKDVKSYDINKLLEMLDTGLLPECFIIFLESRTKK